MSLASVMGIPGRQLLPYRSGYGASILAGNPKIMPIGGSLDWNLFPAAGSNITLPDTELILAGWRHGRYGQVCTRVTNASASILTIGGGATAGTFRITVTNSVGTEGSSADTTAAIPFGATALQVRSSLEALFNVGSGNAIVTGNGPYNITLASAVLGVSTFSADAGSLTGGTPTAVFSTGPGGNSRFFGPYDTAATDGRQNVTRGDVFVLNRTMVMGGSLQLPLQDDVHTSECVIGGRVWKAKVIATDGAHSAAAGPTWTELLAALPELYPVQV